MHGTRVGLMDLYGVAPYENTSQRKIPNDHTSVDSVKIHTWLENISTAVHLTDKHSGSFISNLLLECAKKESMSELKSHDAFFF